MSSIRRRTFTALLMATAVGTRRASGVASRQGGARDSSDTSGYSEGGYGDGPYGGGDQDTSSGISVNVTADKTEVTVPPGEALSVSYTLRNVGEADATSGGMEIAVPEPLWISSVTGDGSNAPDRFFFDPVPAGESFDVTYTFRSDENTTDTTVTINAMGTLVTANASQTDSTKVAVSISEPSGLPTEPGEPDLTDVLSVVSAYNTGDAYNGVEVTLTDVLEVLSAYNTG